MRKQGNFSKAIDELMGGKFSESEGEKNGQDAGQPDTEAVQVAQSAVRRIDGKVEEAIITRDMVIKGTITSSANIVISGNIVGDVVSEGDVVVEGKIEGNLKVHSLSVQEGAIMGDIDASGNVIVAENSSIDGDIKAERIEVNGKIVGNLQSATKIILNPHSAIEGNVTAATLSMLEGAELNGSMSVKKSGGE